MGAEAFPFEIVPDESLTRGDIIALPEKLRKGIGVQPGQRIQLQGRVLKVINTDVGEQARLAPSVFEAFSKTPLQFEIPQITLGCDPEFFLVQGRRFMCAAVYLPFVGQIGSDGSLGELRPDYGTHETQVVGNLRKLISQIPSKVGRRDFTYEAHSIFGGAAAGFHVHLGLPPEMIHTVQTFHKAALEHLVRGLDWYVSGLLAHIEVDRYKRCGLNGYGLPGDYRMSNYTMEYRTPGGFFLRNPILAAGLMGTSLLVAEHFVNRLAPASRGFLDLGRLSPGDLDEVLPLPRPLVIRSALVDPSKKVITQALPRIIADLRNMPEFGRHQGSIEEFIKVVEAGHPPSPNLIANWRE